jgi:DNA repair exonuclease SbcCD ATPase subunit
MKTLDEVFAKIQSVKQQQRELRKSYKEALERVPSYKSTVEDLTALREKKKKIEAQVREEFSKEFDKLEELKLDLEENNIMLTDIALSKLMKGEHVEVKDQYNLVYEPLFVVRFKKTNVVNEETQKGEVRTVQYDQKASEDLPQVNLF